MHTVSDTVPILVYHQVTRGAAGRERPGLVVDESAFRRQLFLLRGLGYHSISLPQLVAALGGSASIPRRAVVFTFDDGYSGVYDCAFPALRRCGFTATLFLIAEDFAGATPPPGRRAFPIVQPSQVREMLAAGFDIGSHTVTHSHLTDLSPALAREELSQSRVILESTLGRTPAAFCYPYGDYSPVLQEQVRECGYACAVTTRFGRQHRLENQFALSRIPVGSAQGLAEFAYRLLWAREQGTANGSGH